MPSSVRPIFSYAKFDVDSLCNRASALRGGVRCGCDLNKFPLTGSLNWVVSIYFEDGVEWLLRSPSNEYGAVSCRKTNAKLLESEAVTLRYIKLHSSIPVPEVFDYRPNYDNPVGIPYILMSKAPGHALQRSWSSMSKSLRTRVLYQLGDVVCQLSRLRFDRIGSLFEGLDGTVVKESLSRSFVVHDRYLLDEVPRGPFTLASDYYASLMSILREHASCLRLSPRCLLAPCPLPEEYDTNEHFEDSRDRWHDFVRLGSKIDSSANRMDYIIMSDLLAEMRKEWADTTYPEEEKQRIFTLHHPDLSVNNIFVDDTGNVTCIIDWAFCSSVPLPLTLTAPGLPQSRHEISDELFTAFKLGFQLSQLSANMTLKDRILNCRILCRSRPMWLLSRLVGFDAMNDYPILRDLWICIRGRSEEALLEEIGSRQFSDVYSEIITELKEDYDAPNEAAEAATFRNRSVTDLTICKKLTMISQWPLRYTITDPRGLRQYGTPFIADRRVWRWISGCIPEHASQPDAVGNGRYEDIEFS